MSYSNWASKRKTIYTIAFILILASFVIVPLAIKIVSIKPTCFDGKQNQGETAPDMGGPCERLDPRFVEDIKIVWARALKVRKGYYNAIVYIQNSNQDAAAKSVPYVMRFFDEKNVLIAKRYGKTDIYPAMMFPVFEGAIDSGELDIKRMSFEFLEQPIWIKREKRPMDGLKIIQQDLRFTPHSTILEATIKNTSFDDKYDITVVATLFDQNGSALASSKSYIAYLLPDKSKKIIFTWPARFKPEPTSFDIVPLMKIE